MVVIEYPGKFSSELPLFLEGNTKRKTEEHFLNRKV